MPCFSVLELETSNHRYNFVIQKQYIFIQYSFYYFKLTKRGCKVVYVLILSRRLSINSSIFLQTKLLCYGKSVS